MCVASAVRISREFETSSTNRIDDQIFDECNNKLRDRKVSPSEEFGRREEELLFGVYLGTTIVNRSLQLSNRVGTYDSCIVYNVIWHEDCQTAGMPDIPVDFTIDRDTLPSPYLFSVARYSRPNWSNRPKRERYSRISSLLGKFDSIRLRHSHGS